MIESYPYGRDENGELLYESVEEAFFLTLGPPSYLLQPNAPMSFGVPMPASVVHAKPAERII
eukprot:1659810-Pleurochrysis_carterae.AAC.1